MTRFDIKATKNLVIFFLTQASPLWSSAAVVLPSSTQHHQTESMEYQQGKSRVSLSLIMTTWLKNNTWLLPLSTTWLILRSLEFQECGNYAKAHCAGGNAHLTPLTSLSHSPNNALFTLSASSGAANHQPSAGLIPISTCSPVGVSVRRTPLNKL